MTITIDFNKPATTDNYSTAFVPGLQANLQSLGALLDPTYVTAVSNAPAGTKRFNSSSGLFEQWNGSAWVALVVGYAKTAGDAFSGAMTFANNIALQWKDSGGSARRIGVLTAANNISFGDVDGALAGSHLQLVSNSAGAVDFYVGGTVVTTVGSAGMSTTGNISYFAQPGSSEGFRVAHNTGFISGYNGANSTRTGYLQFNSGTGVTLSADGATGLSFNTNGSTRLAINASGNCGFGTTIPSWGSSFTSLQLNGGAFSSIGAGPYITQNCYYDGGAWRYVASGYAAMYSVQNSSGHQWYVTPSGAAAASITWTNAMTLDQSGNLTLTPGTLSVGAFGLAGSQGVRSNSGFNNIWPGSSGVNGNAYWTTKDGGSTYNGFAWQMGGAYSADLYVGDGSAAWNKRLTIAQNGQGVINGSMATTTNAMGSVSGGVTINANVSNVHFLTLNGNMTSLTIANYADGQTLNVFIKQDATGSRIATWPASFKWPNGVAGALSTAANATDLLCITYVAATGFWYATIAKAMA